LGISAKNQIGLVKQQFSIEIPCRWSFATGIQRTDAPKENRRSQAEIKCERRTAAAAPMTCDTVLGKRLACLKRELRD